jgi:hypothetical protein
MCYSPVAKYVHSARLSLQRRRRSASNLFSRAIRFSLTGQVTCRLWTICKCNGTSSVLLGIYSRIANKVANLILVPFSLLAEWLKLLHHLLQHLVSARHSKCLLGNRSLANCLLQ